MDGVEWHTCHFCGTLINSEGYEVKGARHFLSDCRPDLVEHEIGELCTWYVKSPVVAVSFGLEPIPQELTCYAYQDSDLNWTKEHKHFYPDGPM